MTEQNSPAARYATLRDYIAVLRRYWWVIGIIALLVSILLPTLGRAREKANQVKCAAQQRQILQGMILHANDHRGWMPLAGLSDPPAAHIARLRHVLTATWPNADRRLEKRLRRILLDRHAVMSALSSGASVSPNRVGYVARIGSAPVARIATTRESRSPDPSSASDHQHPPRIAGKLVLKRYLVPGGD